jgi:hypothetical protein
MATRNQYAIQTRSKGLYYEVGSNPGRAWNPDYAYGGWIDQPRGTGKIRTGVGTPLAEEANDPWLPTAATDLFFTHSVLSSADSSHLKANFA